MPKISIVILTYNRASILRELLISVSSIEYECLEIIVVDNFSQDGTDQMVTEEFPQVIYIRLKSNIGAAGRNFGLQKAIGEIIVTLDDDIFGVNDAFLTSLCPLFSSRPDLGAINFKITNYFTGEICNWAHHRSIAENADKEFPTYEITEGAVAFRRKALEKVGYYPDYFFLSHEGPDLALRLMESGYTVIYSNVVSVMHKHSNLGRRNWLNYYYDTRNQFWFAARNLPVAYAAVYLFRGLSSMFFYSLRDGYLLYWLKAVKDGLNGLARALGDRKVVSKETILRVRHIDTHRVGLTSLLRERVLSRGARL